MESPGKFLRPARSRRRFDLRPGLICLALIVWSGGALSAAEGGFEYRVKATFLFNFAKFVTWPAAAQGAAGAPTVVGILGQDPFGAVLDQTLAGQSVGGHPFQIRRLTSQDALTGCHLLFISRSEKDRLASLLPSLRDHPVLTVGETDGFCQQGGLVNFAVVEGKVKIEINPVECEKSGLKVSSKLLSVAKVVQTAAKN